MDWLLALCQVVHLLCQLLMVSSLFYHSVVLIFGKLYKKMPLIQTLGNRIAKRRWLGLMRMDNDLNASQQIRIKCVRRMRLAGVQSWLLHQSLYPFAINHAPWSTQVLGHPACAIERMPCILFIKQLQQQTLILIYRFWLPLFIDDWTCDGK